MSKISIFISHATPEDNDFVRWLGARLELAGYQVWHDLGRLKGGDYFWDKIENTIRNDTYRFLAVVSKSSVGKQGGVKDEWALGLALEKSIPGFVLPVRVDSCDFSLLPIGLNRKNVIDFWGGWHKGLGNLLDTLSECNAPRVFQPDPRAARHWLPEMNVGAVVRTSRGELVDSTWLRIISMPPRT